MTPYPEAPRAVMVEAPARLHLGFLDLNGGLGRKFVSFGLAIDSPVTRLRLERAPEGVSAEGPDSGRAAEKLALLAAHYGASSGLRLTIEEAIAPHAGLGSGTQLALAAAAAFKALENRPEPLAQMAALLDRGARSGIGLAAFEGGGALLDGGRGPATETPPLLARIAIPEAWRLILIFDPAESGVSGAAEKAAFAELPPFPADDSAHLCRRLLVEALPALAEGELGPFARVVTALQARMGDHFAPRQGGGRFSSPLVAEALAFMAAQGVEGYGQSSWGPTGFGLFATEADARSCLAALEARFSGARLRFGVARPRNGGARVERLA